MGVLQAPTEIRRIPPLKRAGSAPEGVFALCLSQLLHPILRVPVRRLWK